jgi:hypothetical protein
MSFAEIYYDAANPGGFGGASRLAKQAHGNPKGWLQSQKTYTLYRPVTRKYRKRKYIVPGIDYLWQADLADMASLSQWNNGYKYILVVIDVFSKYVWAKPVKSKTAKEVLGAFNMMMSDERKPKHFMTDKGKEFDNVHMRNYCQRNDINYYTSQNPDTKAAVAERVIRTLKSKMYRYFHHKKAWKYTDVLAKIVSSYNKSKHRSIGMAPKDVSKENEAQVHKKLYPAKDRKPIKFKFSVGDTVRIAREKPVFGKGYHQQWSDEIFTIAQRNVTDPPTYKLKDYNEQIIVGSFYEPELQLVTDTGVYEVEEILKTRDRNGKTEYFVSWKGYPRSAASWVQDLI